MKVAVVVFPGSNGDHDAYYAAKHVLGLEAEYVWHKETSLGGADVVVLPGGFAHGDYLRCGAIARFSPIMREVKRFAAQGGPVIGFCNGFQVLLEAGLLPGAMLRNESLRFQCEHVYVKVEQTDTPFTLECRPGQVLRIPIAHGEGNYYAGPEIVERLERNRQVVFRYTTPTGEATPGANVNGSLHNIAGICNEMRNVVGLMPHPERACELAVGSADGLVIFESVMKAVSQGVATSVGGTAAPLAHYAADRSAKAPSPDRNATASLRDRDATASSTNRSARASALAEN